MSVFQLTVNQFLLCINSSTFTFPFTHLQFSRWCLLFECCNALWARYTAGVTWPVLQSHKYNGSIYEGPVQKMAKPQPNGAGQIHWWSPSVCCMYLLLLMLCSALLNGGGEGSLLWTSLFYFSSFTSPVLLLEHTFPFHVGHVTLLCWWGGSVIPTRAMSAGAFASGRFNLATLV